MKKIILFISLIIAGQNLFSQFTLCNSSTNKTLYDIRFMDQNIGIAVGDSGTVIRSTDGGINWSLIMSNDTVVFKKVNFFDTLNGIAIGSDIYTTNDAGLSWTHISHANVFFYDLEILNQTTCLISGYPTSIIKSTNLGATFSNLSTNDNIGLLSFINENIGYSTALGGGSSPILKTIDGGSSWLLVDNGATFNTVVEAFSFVSEEIGFKGGWYNPTLNKTIDSANTWNNVNFENPSSNPNIVDFHIEQSQPNSYYACGWDGIIFKSIDNGNNWYELNSGLSSSNSLYGVFFINDSIGWLVGDDGIIIKTTNAGEVLAIDDLSYNKLDIHVYPNPTNGIIKIEHSANYEIKKTTVFSLNGKVIKSFNNNEIININKLTNGFYILQIETNRGIHIENILKK